MPESRSDKRKERYRELRALRFTPDQARRLRDRSGKEIQLAIARERRRISRKPIQLRTADEHFRLQRMQDRQATATEMQRRARLETRQERWEKFSSYSKSGIWPREFRKRVREINRRAGLGPDDGYGYRRFYFEYVERLSLEESIEISERGDSEARYLTNRPLVQGRSNLRRLLRPPTMQQKAS